MKTTPEKIGKNFIVGLESYKLSPLEKKILKKIRPFGIILFARNFTDSSSWRDDLAALLADVQENSEQQTRIISIDFEGGRVNRFPADIKRFPYAQEWKDESYQTAREMGKILFELGINLTYGPVADLDLNENNPVIGKRAFSDDPLSATKACLEFCQAVSELGIFCCGKHFPGHGRTSLDSHFELPIVNCSKTELELDLYPFAELIKMNIPFIMTSHVIYNCLDANLPASLSKKIQTELLRGTLGYKNLIISDDLDMKALKAYSETDKARMALSAGTDLLLFGNGMDGRALETVDSVIDDLGEITDQDFLDSLETSQLRIKEFLGQILPPV